MDYLNKYLKDKSVELRNDGYGAELKSVMAVTGCWAGYRSLRQSGVRTFFTENVYLRLKSLYTSESCNHRGYEFYITLLQKLIREAHK